MHKTLAAILLLTVLCAGLLALDQPAVHASMLGGLRSLTAITKDEMEAMPEATDAVMLMLNGVQLPYDPASNTYFIPQSPHTSHFEGKLELEMLPGYRYYVYPGSEVAKQQALENATGFHIYGVNGESCVYSRIIFTSLPVICLRTRSGQLPQSEAESGVLALFEVSDGKLRCRQSLMEVNLRGNTSRRLPKKSYRVKLLHEDGKNRSLSLGGLRNDDDWILNPMYSDKTKIRESFAYSLWSDLNRSGTAAQSSRFAYAEVFLNGEYWGLYGVQERIDRKQVNGDKRSGLLYKIIANDRPTVDELLTCESPEQCRGFKLEHAGSGVTNPWMPAAAYMNFLDGDFSADRAVLDTANVIDYGLWAMLTQAHDCFFKNQFLNCVYSEDAYVMYKIPWDLNNTFGDVWSNELAEDNHVDFYIGSLVMDSAFETLLKSSDAATLEAIRLRWKELRATILEYNLLVKRAREMHSAIYPAVVRDGKRWPEGGNGSGNAENLRDIEAYLFTILPRMDAFVAGLENTQERMSDG